MPISKYFTDSLNDCEIYTDTFNLANEIIRYRRSVIDLEKDEHFETARKSSRLANIFVIKAWNNREEPKRASILLKEASAEIYAVIASIYFLAEREAIHEDIYKKLSNKGEFIIESINKILSEDER